MENIMMTVFNYAQNDREQFLLIKFFEVAVKEEIEYVFQYMYFIHGGSPGELRIVVVTKKFSCHR